MSNLKLANNAISRLSAGISDVATTVSVMPGDGAKYPTLTAGQYFPATLIRASDGANEIVKVTARATDVLTIVRAQEGTAALTLLASDRIEVRLTAGSFTDEIKRVDDTAASNQTAALAAAGAASTAAGAADSKAAAAKSTADAALPKAGGTMTGDLGMAAGKKIVLDGATANAFKTSLDVVDPTASNTLLFPDKSGTLATIDSIAGIQGASRALVASATGTTANVLESIGEFVVSDGAGSYKALRDLFFTGDIPTEIDTGAVAASSWYSRWVIYNPATSSTLRKFVLAPVLTGNTTSGSGVVTALSSTASMRVGMPLSGANFPAGTVVKTIDSASQITASQPATATTTATNIIFVYEPVMPTGFTMKGRSGWVRTDSTANKHPLAFSQYGNAVQYKVVAGSNLPALPHLATGVVGSGTIPNVAISVSAFVPPTARSIQGDIGTAQYTAIVAMAPNASYGTYVNTVNPPPVWQANGPNNYTHEGFNFVLEGTNIYAIASGAGTYINCLGWEE